MKWFDALGYAFSILVGSIFALVGAGTALSSLHAFPFPKTMDTGLPPLLGAVFGTIFFLAGVKTVSEAVVKINGFETPLIQYIQQTLQMLLSVLLGGIFFWVGMQSEGGEPFWNRVPFLAFGAVTILWGIWKGLQVFAKK